ncbi:MAG: hypothetical protein V3V16_15295 [Melioribacteraceae bacterium]
MKSKIFFVSVFIFFATQISFGQSTKWLAVGSLHNWYSSSGMEIELGRTHLIPDQQDGLRWPALYKKQDSQASKALWIGTLNYNDPKAGKVFNFKVVHMGPRVENIKSEFLPQEFKLVGKFDHPRVFVDGLPAGKLDFLDFVDEVDPDLPADRMIKNVVNTAIGVTMTRKLYAYSQQNHDNYFIYEYVFKNTGIIDLDGTVNPQTLDGVTFFYQYRYAPTKEGGPYGFNWLPQNTSWGRSTVNDVIYELDGNPFRSQFSYLGKHSQFTSSFTNNSIGGPNIGSANSQADGRLAASQFVGTYTIHADKSASDNTDDISQPSATEIVDSDGPITFNNDQFNAAQMSSEYSAMTSGRPANSHAALIGDDFADTFGSTAGGYSQGQGFGPYTLAPGDSVKIVMAESVAGINRDLVRSLGLGLLNSASPYTLPNGTTTTDKNEFQNTWVFTGKDSLFQAFKRAQIVYDGNLELPHAPPPPAQFLVNSGGDRINLKWDSNAESWSNFNGYNVYRSIHQPDTTFELIYQCGPGTENPTIINEYNDTDLQRGFDYYYYITSADDGSTNDYHIGVPLESSKFYTMTNEPAFLKRQPGESLEDIRVVPNPYNIRAREIQFGISGPDRIMFLDIPGECTIKIYTERGDLVKVLEHTDGSGDEAWNSITSSRQTIVSGVYLAIITTPQGEQAIRKFIIIR